MRTNINMEERHIIQTVLVNYRCPECKLGFLVATGLARFPNDTPSEDGINKVMWFEHKCNNPDCGFNDYFEKTYPHKEELINELNEPIITITT